MGVTSGTLSGNPNVSQVIKFYKAPTFSLGGQTTTTSSGSYLLALAAGTYQAKVVSGGNEVLCSPTSFNIPTGAKIQNLSYPALAGGDEEEPPCGCCAATEGSPATLKAYKLKKNATCPSQPFDNHDEYDDKRYTYVYYTATGKCASTVPDVRTHGEEVEIAVLFVMDSGVSSTGQRGGVPPKLDPGLDEPVVVELGCDNGQCL